MPRASSTPDEQAHHSHEEVRRDDQRNGKDEMNLAEFPFASLRNRGDKRKALIYEGWVTDANGNRYKQKWITQGGSLVGLPNEFDERVFIALLALTAEQGFETRRVDFSLYQIVDIMGLTRSKRTYEYLENSLERLLAATFSSQQAFWDHEKEERITTSRGFHLIDEYWLRYKEVDREVAEEEGVPAYLLWNEVIWKSFRAGYIKNLDLELFFSLESPISRRLYRFLDKRMRYQDEYEIDIFDLAGRLGMVRYKYPSKVMEKLQRGLDELTERRFLRSAELVKKGKYTRLHFVRDAESALVEPPPSSVAEQPDEQPDPPPTSAEAEATAPEAGAPERTEQVATELATHEQGTALATLLVEWGIAEQVATTLATRYDASLIWEKIEFLEWVQQQDPEQIKSPSGWLRCAIEEDYAAPDGFQTRTELAAGEQARAAEQARWEDAFAARAERQRDPLLPWMKQVSEAYHLSPALQTLTDDLQESLRRQMPATVYNRYGTRLMIVAVDRVQRTIHLVVPTQHNLEVLNSKYKRALASSARWVFGEETQVTCAVWPDADA